MCRQQQLRQEAIVKLRQSPEINSEYCLVGETRIRKSEKTTLLKELENDKEDLSVPMALYFSSPFWRELNRETNRQRLATQEFSR